jgi:hypothetical protein
LNGCFAESVDERKSPTSQKGRAADIGPQWVGSISGLADPVFAALPPRPRWENVCFPRRHADAVPWFELSECSGETAEKLKSPTSQKGRATKIRPQQVRWFRGIAGSSACDDAEPQGALSQGAATTGREMAGT